MFPSASSPLSSDSSGSDGSPWPPLPLAWQSSRREGGESEESKDDGAPESLTAFSARMLASLPQPQFPSPQQCVDPPFACPAAASSSPAASAAAPVSAAGAAVAANGPPSALHIDLSAGLSAQLQSIALRFGVSTAVALCEFERFLELKQFVKDSRSEKLSPTPLMDAVWHAALLETELYERVEAHTGMRLHHSTASAPSDAAATVAREERLTAMRQLYKLRYNERPVEQVPAAATTVTSAPASSSVQARSFLLTLKPQSVHLPPFLVSSTSPLAAVKQQIQDKMGWPVHQQEFRMDGHLLGDALTMHKVGIQEGDNLTLVLRQ